MLEPQVIGLHRQTDLIVPVASRIRARIVNTSVITAITALTCVYGTSSGAFLPADDSDAATPRIGTRPATTFRNRPDWLFHRRSSVNANRREAAPKAIPVTDSGSSLFHSRYAP